jgi:hypothetical protein
MPAAAPSASLLDHFSALSDPRQQWRVSTRCRRFCCWFSARRSVEWRIFVEIRLWGEQRLDFLRRFLPYERGLPSHDALNDVFNALDPELFETCFVEWAAALRDNAPDVIAIDGKTSRRSHARGPRAASRCISSRPGRRASASSSPRRPWTKNPMTSSLFPCCCSGCSSPAPW